MNLKEQYNYLVDSVQIFYKKKGEKKTKEEIASLLNLTRTYFSALLGGSAEVKQYHIDDLKLKFKEELEGGKHPPGDETKDRLNDAEITYDNPRNVTELVEAILSQTIAINKLTDSYKELIESNRILTETNRQLTETNKQLSDKILMLEQGKAVPPAAAS